MRTCINIDWVEEIPDTYPEDFLDFCKQYHLTPPRIQSNRGKALSVMLRFKDCYWDRNSCNAFVEKFNIQSKDSIQLFNKHSQWGIQTNSGIEIGKLYIVYPYELSSKHNMRKAFHYHGTTEEKNAAIDRIKSTIETDYIKIPNSQWHLGHKNPEHILDHSFSNMVLQPPIQAKYRDNYIFIDTLTKFPTPKKLTSMVQANAIQFTMKQIYEYKVLFDTLYQLRK